MLPVFPNALPKNEIRSFWGKWVPWFWGYVMTQPQCLQGFQAITDFPNPQKGNITMSWGNVIYSVWGKQFSPLHFVKVRPHSMVIGYGMFQKV